MRVFTQGMRLPQNEVRGRRVPGDHLLPWDLYRGGNALGQGKGFASFHRVELLHSSECQLCGFCKHSSRWQGDENSPGGPWGRDWGAFRASEDPDVDLGLWGGSTACKQELHKQSWKPTADEAAQGVSECLSLTCEQDRTSAHL